MWNQNEILKLRKHFEMTQTDFADRLETTNVTVSRWESGNSRANRKAESKLNQLWNSIELAERAKIKPIWYYPTNDWGDYKWVKVQTWREGKNRKWKWYPVDKVSNFHDNNAHTLIFQTISHYLYQDTQSKQISNLCFDWDVGGETEEEWKKNFSRCRRSVLDTIEFFWDLGLKEQEIRAFFSGGRSYHMEIPYQPLGIEPQVELNSLMKLLALDVNEYILEKNGSFEGKDGKIHGLYALEIDKTLYANPKQFRTPNSLYPQGEDYPPHDTHKIELTHQEVEEIETIDELWELAQEPRPPLYDTDVFETYEPRDWAVEWYHEMKEQFDEQEKITEHVPAYIDDDTLKLMDDLPACIADLRKHGIKQKETLNQATLCDACWCKSSGISQSEAIRTIDAWNQKVSDKLTSKKRGKERTRHVRSVVKTVYEKKKKKKKEKKEKSYKFACGYIRNIGMKCVHDNCPLYHKYDLRRLGKKIKKVENIELSEDNIHYVENVEEARDYLKEKINDSVFNSKSAILTQPPGIGKTHTAIEAMEKLLPRFIYAGNRHENCNFVFEEVAQNDSWTQILPRRPREPKPKDEKLIPQWKASALCPLFETADKLATLRYNVGSILCAEGEEGKNPMWCGIPKHDCEWWNQFVTDKSATIVQEYLFIPTLMELLIGNYNTFSEYDNMMSEAPVIVLDEPAPDTFIEKVVISVETLTKTIEKTDHDCIRELLQLIRKVIEDALPNGKKEATLGNAVMKALIENGNDMEYLLRHVQETVTKPNFVDIEAESLWDGTEKAYQVSVDGQMVWIPQEWEVIMSKDCILFRVPYDFAEENEILPKKTNGLNAEKEEHGLILQFMDDLIKLLKKEYDRYQADEAYNSALAIERTLKEGNSLVMRLRQYHKIPEDVPLMVLDANGDRELLSYLTERELTEHHVSVKTDCRIVQILDGKYGITTLYDKKTGNPRDSFWRLLKVVRQLAEQEDPSKILIITWKVIEEILVEMQKEGTLPKAININHFGNIRGSNENENREIAIILGTPCPKVDDMTMQAQALHYDQDYVSAELETYEKQYNYNEDGNGYKIELERYKDKRMEAIRNRYREMEIYQAAHRIRPLLTGGKTIYLLTNLPIDLLPPDEMYLVDELSDMTNAEYQEFERKLVEFADANGGIWRKLARSLTDVTLHKLTSWFDLACKQNGFKNKEQVAVDGNNWITVYYKDEIDANRIKIAYFLEKNDIAGLRKEFGLTQKEFSEKLGHTKNYVSMIESGKRKVTKEMKERVLLTFTKKPKPEAL